MILKLIEIALIILISSLTTAMFIVGGIEYIINKYDLKDKNKKDD